MQAVMHETGVCWLDIQRKPIQAHGGGVLWHEGVYYWYGENRDVPAGNHADPVHIKSRGVSCYRSRDLVAWEHVGVVLPTVDDSSHDLHPTRVIERPKVIFNATTGQFVMWLHIDSPDYKAACVGVAVADDPAGPFRYLQSFRPNGFESRDQTIFQDDDGRTYHLCASDGNRNTMISLLSDDYLTTSGQYVKLFHDRYMEALAVCRRDGRYWLIASGCTGWEPNEARSAVADSMMGPWEELGNPCVGEHAGLTFGGQSTFIVPPTSNGEPYIAMFDIWRPKDLKASGYMWLPIDWSNERMSIPWRPTWNGIGDSRPCTAT